MTASNDQSQTVCDSPQDCADFIQVIILSGMSGSGKTIALNALEDLGYFCVDNLPPELIMDFLVVKRRDDVYRVAISVDVRSAEALHGLPATIRLLEADACVQVRHLFLDAQNETLMRRYSETRRRHPLLGAGNDEQLVLREAIEREREILASIRAANVHVVDTTRMKASDLQTYVKAVVNAGMSAASNMTLVFESFAFKNGPPLDANFVLDVRVLPNPYYNLDLRPLTGRDAPVQAFFAEEPKVQKMLADIGGYLMDWLPESAANHRSYVKVCIGCTGGQHRSVYITEKLYDRFSQQWMCIKRHRELNNVVETSNFSPLMA